MRAFFSVWQKFDMVPVRERERERERKKENERTTHEGREKKEEGKSRRQRGRERKKRRRKRTSLFLLLTFPFRRNVGTRWSPTSKRSSCTTRWRRSFSQRHSSTSICSL